MMIEFLQVFLPLLMYILIIILLIVGIIIGVKVINTLDKINRIADDINDKVQTLNGLFSLIGYTSDKIANITDMITEGFSGLVGKIFKSKKKIKKDEE